jgi:Xaa-Pro dipeptidase
MEADSKKYSKLEVSDRSLEIKALSFSDTEYARRLRITQEIINQRGLDALICVPLNRVCWLIGYETLAAGAPSILIIPASGKPTLLVEDFEAFNTITSTSVDDVVTYPWADTPESAVIELLNDRKWAGKRIGWDNHPWFYYTFSKVQEGVKAHWSVETSIIELARSCKGADEIEALRVAGGMGEKGFYAAYGAIREGAQDNDLVAAGYEAITREGSEGMNLHPICTVARRSGIPHTTFGRHPIERGLPVLLEFGGCYKRYTSPMIRTAFLGEPANQLWVDMHDACSEAVRNTIALMKPGASTMEIADEASKPLYALDKRVFVDGNRGYSVGLGFPPFGWGDCPGLQISTAEFQKERVEEYHELRVGNVFHVRAMARHVGEAGVGNSETVVVTENGCEVLTYNNQDRIIIE